MTTLVVVAGVSRSGSTVTDFILGNRKDAFSLGEIYALYRPFRAHHVTPKCSCGQAPDRCPIWSMIGRPRARHLHRTVADTLGVTYVIDSSKNLGWIRDAARWGARAGMDVRVLLPWRGTKMIAHSYWKRGVGDWLENMEGYLRRLDQLGLPWVSLPFERMLASPERALQPFYETTNGRYVPGQEQFWRGDFHSFFGSGGTVGQLGAQSVLDAPTLDSEFETYWSGLGSQTLERISRLEQLVLEGNAGDAGIARSLVPPPWYLKHRLLALRDSTRVRVWQDRDVR